MDRNLKKAREQSTPVKGQGTPVQVTAVQRPCGGDSLEYVGPACVSEVDRAGGEWGEIRSEKKCRVRSCWSP